MKRYISALCLGAAVLLANSAQATIINFVVPLSGAQEVAGGDPDGTGSASLSIDDFALTISWLISVANIDLPVFGAHIHSAAAGVNGPVVIDFSAQLSGSGLADPDLASVLANPLNFYVNVHNSLHPGGAIRGQLGNPTSVPEPATATLMLLGLVGLGEKMRRFRRHGAMDKESA